MQLSKVKQIGTANNGFSLISVMVAIVILGILAVMAKPTVDSIYARARMAEAKNNLEFIKRSQEQRYLTHKSYEPFPASGTGGSGIGYIGNGNHNCPSPSPHTFVPGACESLRYNYRAKVRPGIFEVEAVAPSDKEKYYIYAGCDGAGTSIYNKNKGDVWIIRNHSNPIHCRDILDFCPSATGKGKNGCKSLIAFNTAPALPLPTCATACGNWSSWNYTSWSPSTSSYCSGTSFTQTRTKYRTRTCPSGSICSKNESSQQSQTATGTSLSCSCCGNYGSWSYSGSWSPSTSSYCSGTSFTQTRGMTRSRTCPVGSTCTTTQSSSTSRTATGTSLSCSCCGNYGSWTYYGSWSPSTSSYCSGTNFTQTRSTRRTRSCPSGSNCTQTQYSSTNRNATGTKSCTTPNCSNCDTACTNVNYSNCGTCSYRWANGGYGYYEYCYRTRNNCGSCSSSCSGAGWAYRNCSLTPTPTPTPNCSNCDTACTNWNWGTCGSCSYRWANGRYGYYEYCPNKTRNCGSCTSCSDSESGYRSCSLTPTPTPTLTPTPTPTQAPITPTPPSYPSPPSSPSECDSNCGRWEWSNNSCSPDPSTVCNFTYFRQACSRYRDRACNLSSETVCLVREDFISAKDQLGTSYNNNCDSPASPSCKTCSQTCSKWKNGVIKNCTPARSTKCSGVSFKQTCTASRTRTCNGSVCSGSECKTEQYRENKQTRTGTKSCPTPTPTPAPTCADKPCSSACRTEVSRGSCHGNHTHYTGWHHTDWMIHVKHECADGSTKWTEESCTPDSPSCDTSSQCCDGNTEVPNTYGEKNCTSWRGNFNSSDDRKGCCKCGSGCWWGTGVTPNRCRTKCSKPGGGDKYYDCGDSEPSECSPSDSDCKSDPCQSGCSGTYWYNHCSNGQTSHTHSSKGVGHTHSGNGTNSVHHGHGTYCSSGTKKYTRQDC